MIKRSINPIFNAAVCDGIKITTIRENPWPVGKDIMLYNWKGRPYHTKQVNIAVINVVFTMEITIHNTAGRLIYSPHLVASTDLYITEGFKDQAQMDQWFEKIVKPGETRTFHLMRFSLADIATQPVFFQNHKLEAAFK